MMKYTCRYCQNKGLWIKGVVLLIYFVFDFAKSSSHFRYVSGKFPAVHHNDNKWKIIRHHNHCNNQPRRSHGRKRPHYDKVLIQRGGDGGGMEEQISKDDEDDEQRNTATTKTAAGDGVNEVHENELSSTDNQKKTPEIEEHAADPKVTEQSSNKADPSMENATEEYAVVDDNHNVAAEEKSSSQEDQQQSNVAIDNDTNDTNTKLREGTEKEEGTIRESSSSTSTREEALQLRLQGKELHDEGNLEDAAQTFKRASDLLRSLGDSDSDSSNCEEEYATCKLHEALCRLKQKDYQKCIDSCTDVLSMNKKKSSQTSANKGVDNTNISAAIQARAHHRRAKAKLGLDDTSGALQDARSAAFLGDRKAVALYGRLMRETSLSASSPSDGIMNNENEADSPAAALSDLLQGRNPFLNDATAATANTPNNPGAADSAALFQSLLSKSNANNNNDVSPLGDMLSLLSGNNPLLVGNQKKTKNGKKGKNESTSGSSLAKSVLTSLTKRIEDESTQDTICKYLQKADKNQLQSLATMAGVPLADGQASKLVSLAHGVTKKGIRKSIKTTKRVWSTIQFARKTMRLISKYKHFIILWLTIAWIRAAINRPYPTPKTKR